MAELFMKPQPQRERSSPSPGELPGGGAAMTDSLDAFSSDLKKRRDGDGAGTTAAGSINAGVTFSVEAPGAEEPRRSLDACFLCLKPFRRSSDVFMYRGDTPFCSEDCRREQIELDDAREREIRHRQRSRRRNAVAAAEKTAPAAEAPSLQPQAAEAVVAG